MGVWMELAFYYTRFELRRFWSNGFLKLNIDLVADNVNFMLAPMHIGVRMEMLQRSSGVARQSISRRQVPQRKVWKALQQEGM